MMNSFIYDFESQGAVHQTLIGVRITLSMLANDRVILSQFYGKIGNIPGVLNMFVSVFFIEKKY